MKTLDLLNTSEEERLRKELETAINKIIAAHRFSSPRGYCNCEQMIYFYMAGKSFLNLLVGWNAVHSIDSLKNSKEYEYYVIERLSRELNSIPCPICHGVSNDED